MNFSRFGIATLLTVSLLTGTAAYAQDATTTTSAAAAVTTAAPASLPAQEKVVSINAKGDVLIRGTIVSIASTSLTISSWGGNWTITINPTTETVPHQLAKNDLSYFRVGDFVGAQGTVASGAFTVDAKVVRDWSARTAVSAEAKQNQANIKITEKTGRENGIGRIFEGTAVNTNGGTFSLMTSTSSIYTVSVSSSTTMVDKNFRTLPGLSLVQTNDHIRIFGTATGGVISAIVIRDTSIPR